jgi:hypothetical protein
MEEEKGSHYVGPTYKLILSLSFSFRRKQDGEQGRKTFPSLFFSFTLISSNQTTKIPYPFFPFPPPISFPYLFPQTKQTVKLMKYDV